MNDQVLIVGEGLLADFVSAQIASLYPMIHHTDLSENIPKETTFAVVLHDAWYPAIHQKAEKRFRQAAIPWFSGFVSFGEGIIGPLVQPHTPGCSQCATTRRLMSGYDRKEMWSIYQQRLHNKSINSDVWASSTGIIQLAHLINVQIQRVFQGLPTQLENQICLLNLKSLQNTYRSFLPNPTCSMCGTLPDDSPTEACITLKSSPKINSDRYRCRSLDELKTFLDKDYVDTRTGCLNRKTQDFISPFASVTVNLPLFNSDEASAGRTHSYAESELTAILEGLERYCGLTPRGKRTVVHDSYCNVKDHALHPLTVGVHTDEQYAQAHFPFQSFDPEDPLSWVWGYSLIQNRALLIPELLAYYSLGQGKGFVYETSNGCALGGSLEEAIFYGILEVIERDSFLMTWYAKLQLPRLNLNSADDQELQLMIQRLQDVAGYDLHLFNATMENGIPSIWALAKNRKSTGMNLICAAGAHLNPIQAAKSAIHELAGMMHLLPKTSTSNQEKYRRMLEDSSLVQQMEDHSLLYSLPEAEERLAFLFSSNHKEQSFQDIQWEKKIPNDDLTNDLQDILQRFRALHMDVIVVNQTTPELKRNNLHCVKVIIPGMLPMTFGHHLTRLTGLDRVLHVPSKLGYRERPLKAEELNPHPHPFP